MKCTHTYKNIKHKIVRHWVEVLFKDVEEIQNIHHLTNTKISKETHIDVPFSFLLLLFSNFLNNFYVLEDKNQQPEKLK